MAKKEKTTEAVKEPLYCLTGRNRLTGEREIISRPMTRKDAEATRLRYARMPARSKPYTHSKVEKYLPWPHLFNN